jgi:hypothetical protein
MMTDKRMRRGAATIALFAAALALATAAAIVLTGGFALDAIALTLKNPWRPFVAGLALLAVARIVAGEAFAEIARPYVGSRERVPARVAALASACVLVFALAWTSRSAGGSDSSCYVLQAEAFARGQATLSNPVARVLPDAPNAVFAPIGFLPSPREYGTAVPICAPGLAIAMALVYLVHPAAVFLVVPVCAALLVWLTFLYGRRLDGELTGACAAVLIACSPIFLYQAVQPMSDVPAAAAWLAALVLTSRGDRAGAIVGGMYAAIAILIRPNLALLTIPLLFLKKGTAPISSPEKGDSPLFLGAVVPGVAVLLALNFVRYGGVFASGYGDAGTLFSVDRVAQNLARYPRWILETQTPFVLLALAAPWALRHPVRTRLAWVSLASIALLLATYLAYTVFDDWWYLRFLLPALPLALAMSVAVLRVLAGGMPASAGRFALSVVTAALAVWYIQVARDRRVTDLQALESRFARAGDYAGRSLPANAVVLAVQESGSIRFHGRRDTIVWDAIPDEALDAYLDRLRAAGHVPYIALEDQEEERFRLRFARQRAGALDWRPLVELPAPRRVRFYEPVADSRR